MWQLAWPFRYSYLPQKPFFADLAKPVIALSARVAVDLNLFALVVNHGPVTSASLATLCGAEELLIRE